MPRFRNNPETSWWAIAHLHSAKLVDWAQRTLPIKNRLTPNLSKYRKFVSRHSPFAQRYWFLDPAS